ncbi:hypothetical protein ACH5RR_029950 [Cinchona calisaya]|uniref:Pyridoxamine kinase/Phosphomethylpyrimidine kinase domain-containing protein n=1 Tax=Cinchona calisaya TaxID=153742 RepID=A0ABD2YWD1_9GENT
MLTFREITPKEVGVNTTANSVHPGLKMTSLMRHSALIISKDFFEFHSSHVITPNTHGTGCSLDSHIAAELAKGSSRIFVVKVLAKGSLVISAIKVCDWKISFLNDDEPVI